MSESVDGLRYIMSFDADTKAFEAAIDRMRKGIESLQKTGATLMSGGGSSGSRGGGSGGGGSGNAATDAERTAKVLNDRIRGLRRQQVREESRESDSKRAREQKDRDKKFDEEVKDTQKRLNHFDSWNKKLSDKYTQNERQNYRRGGVGAYDQFGGRQSRAYMNGKPGAVGGGLPAGEGGDSSGGFFGKASALVVGMELGKAQRFAEGVADAAWNSVAAFGQLYGKSVEEAAVFQDIESGLKFAFGEDKYAKVFENVKKEAIKTSFTLAETAELTRSLGMLKINPFEGTDGKALQFIGRNGEMVSSLEVLQDAASATGKNTKSIQVAIREFMGGNDVSLARRLDIPLTKVHEWRKEVSKTKDVQGQFNILMGKLGGMYGGASAGMRNNWNFLSAQIPDIKQKLLGGMGESALKAMTPGFKTLIDSLMRLSDSKSAVDSLAEAFTVIGKVAGAGMAGLGKLIDFGTKLIETEPHIPLFVAGIVGLGVAAVGTTASFTAMGLSLAVIAAGIAAVGLEIAAVALVPTLLAGATAAVAFGVGASLMTGAFASSQSSTSGFVETLKDARVMVVALQEAFASWGDSTYEISEESYQALEKRGIMGYFEQVVDWANRAEKFVRGFGKGLSEGVGPQLKAVGATFDEIVDTVTGMLAAIGLIGPHTTTAAVEAGASGESMGKKVSGALNLILKGVNMVQGAFLYMFENAPDIIRSLAEVWFIARLTANVFQQGFAVVSAFAGMIWYGMVSPMRMLYEQTMSWVDILRIGLSYAGEAADMIAGKDLTPEEKKLRQDERTGLLASAAQHTTNSAELEQGILPGLANTMGTFRKDTVQNLKDVSSAYDQRRGMLDFATKFENAYEEVQTRRDMEGFDTTRREGLAGPELFTPYRKPAEANFSGEFRSQMPWAGDPSVQPLLAAGEAVRQTQVINLVLQVDATKVHEATMSLAEDQATMSGGGLSYSANK